MFVKSNRFGKEQLRNTIAVKANHRRESAAKTSGVPFPEAFFGIFSKREILVDLERVLMETWVSNSARRGQTRAGLCRSLGCVTGGPRWR